MRLFIAVMVPEKLSHTIEQAQKPFEKLKLDAKFVEPTNFHYNLKFLGEVDEDKIPEIKHAINKIASQHSKFDAYISGIGAFPSKNYARVIWAGATEGSKRLEAIANQVDKAMGKLGFPEESRPFTAHLTLCRLHSGFNDPKLLKALHTSEQADFGALTVKKLELVQSILSKAGPIYKTIHEAPLR